MIKIIEIEPTEKEIIELIIMDDESRFLDWEWDLIYGYESKKMETSNG